MGPPRRQLAGAAQVRQSLADYLFDREMRAPDGSPAGTPGKHRIQPPHERSVMAGSIAMRIIPDDTRIAVFSGRGFHGFKGPGLVILPSLPGRHRALLRVGDRGTMMGRSTAAFGGSNVPVIREGGVLSGPVEIRDFAPASVVVGPATPAFRTPSDPVNPYPMALDHLVSAGQSDNPLFSILATLALIAAIAWAGVLYAYSRFELEAVVYEAGLPTTATVLDKSQIRGDTGNPDGVTGYAVKYSFEVGEREYVSTAMLDYAAWNLLRKGAPLKVRYVPEDPSLSLPDGVREAGVFRMLASFSFTVAVLFTTAAVAVVTHGIHRRHNP